MGRRVLNPPGVFDSLRYGFSQAVEVAGGRRLYLSGQVGVDPDEQTTDRTLAGQVAQSFDNIECVLAAAGARMRDVVMLRLYVVESASTDLAPVTAELRRRFPDDPPASSWLVVSGLARPDWLIEVEAEAVVQAPSG